jgi:hypothetical protein
MSPLFPLGRWLDGSKGQCERCREEIIFSIQEIEPLP